MRAQSPSSGPAAFAATFAIFDYLGSLVANSDILSYYNTTVANQASTGTGRILVTTTASRTYTVRAFATTGSFRSLSDTDGRTGVTYVQVTGGYIGATGLGATGATGATGLTGATGEGATGATG